MAQSCVPHGKMPFTTGNCPSSGEHPAAMTGSCKDTKAQPACLNRGQRWKAILKIWPQDYLGPWPLSLSLCSVCLLSFLSYRFVSWEHSPKNLLHTVLQLKVCFQGIQFKTGIVGRHNRSMDFDVLDIHSWYWHYEL